MRASLWRCAAAAAAVLLATAAHAAGYDDLVAQAKRDPAATDFRALRYAYAATGDFDPYGGIETELRGAMMKAYNDNNCAAAMAKADAILDKNFTNIDAHITLDICYRRLHQEEMAKPHGIMARGLLHSILDEGDGKMPQTAFVVVAIAEEYSVLAVLDLTKLRQTLMSADGHRYDVLTVRNTSNETQQVYFNIDRLHASR